MWAGHDPGLCSCIPPTLPPPAILPILPGRHYLHTMEGSQINSVRVEGSTAFVSATFREAVVAHRGAAEPVQAFRWAGQAADAVQLFRG